MTIEINGDELVFNKNHISAEEIIRDYQDHAMIHPDPHFHLEAVVHPEDGTRAFWAGRDVVHVKEGMRLRCLYGKCPV